jgi:adenylate cyclase class 2
MMSGAEDQELEVKFYVRNLRAVERRLQGLGARLSQPRTHEVNLRFDTPAGELSSGARALRLRQDTAARLTYKGPPSNQGGARLRQEINCGWDFDAAQAFLEALGYQVSLMYEKYRTMYELEGVTVTLDEMPYGDFVEIEGPDITSIQGVNQQLRLEWGARVAESYTMLFEQLKYRMGWAFRDLSFENLKGYNLGPSELHTRQADIK